jgi:hypothetical protein
MCAKERQAKGEVSKEVHWELEEETKAVDVEEKRSAVRWPSEKADSDRDGAA